jgi:type I restriction enzyme S subunit
MPLQSQYKGYALRVIVAESFKEGLSILIPPEKLRKVFHDIVDANFLQMANLEKQIVKLAKARDLLLPKLMNGEVAV